MTKAVGGRVSSLLTVVSGDALRYEFNRAVRGWTMHRHDRGITIAKARETRTGRSMVTAPMSPLWPPRSEMTCTMIRPTTSSIMAALERTTPSLVWDSPLEARTVKVVPRLVEHNAAPAAKAWRGVA